MWCNRFNCDPSIYTNTIDSQATLTSYQTHSYIIIIVVHGSAVCTNSSRQIFLTSDKRSFPVMLLLTFFPKKRKKETTKKKVEARALPRWEATCLPRPHLHKAPGGVPQTDENKPENQDDDALERLNNSKICHFVTVDTIRKCLDTFG